jgi:hypothetical protein
MRYRKASGWSRIVLGFLLTVGIGCASVPKRHPLPVEHLDSAQVPGFEGIRVWGDELPRYDELHVDGRATSQVFLYPAAIDWAKTLEMLESPAPPRVWVIRNSRLDPRATNVRRRMIPILTRTMSSMTRTQGIGDLYRIYALARFTAAVRRPIGPVVRPVKFPGT